MRKITTALVIAFGIPLAACNTWDGMGEDVESAGDAVEDVTDDVGDGQ